MSIFSNYDNTIADNDNVSYPTCDCSKFNNIRAKKPYADYNAEGTQIGYFWYHGDTINLEFTIEGNVTDEENSTYQTADDFLQNKKCVVTLYNFRYEVVDEKVFNGNTTVTYEISKELSDKLIPGVYYCSLKIIKDTTTIYTLFGPNDCVLTVK